MTEQRHEGVPGATTYVGIALRWWWLLIAATVGGGIIAYVASSTITPTYEATGTVLVSHQQIPGVTTRDDVETSVALAHTYSRLIPLAPMLSRAIEQGNFDLSAGEFGESLAVQNPAATPIIELTVESTSPARARDLVNVLAAVFIASPELQATGGAGAVTLVSPASLPGAPTSPQPSMNAMLGGLLAFVAAFLLVLALERWRESRRPVPLPLGRARRASGRRGTRIATNDPHQPGVESTASTS